MPDAVAAGAVVPATVAGITEREFRAVSTLVYREAGIHLGPTKHALVHGRLARRVRELGLRSIGDYCRLVEERRGPELVCLIDAIATNETHFFREPRHFEFLAQQVFPAWRAAAAAGARPRSVRVWSAACSTGEEPFSLAMLLLAHLPADEGWHHHILATDISTKCLARVEAAEWSLERAQEIPRPYLKRFMLRGTGTREGTMKAMPELRAIVESRRVNLHEAELGVAGPFDLVFCRNALIYFDAASKRAAVDRLLDRLDPSGFFFLGHAETLNGVSDRAVSVQPTIYAPGARRAR